MDLVAIVAELRAELARMDNAIFALERLAMAHGARRGRPSKWMLQAKNTQLDGKVGVPSGVRSNAASVFRKTLVNRKSKKT